MTKQLNPERLTIPLMSRGSRTVLIVVLGAAVVSVLGWAVYNMIALITGQAVDSGLIGQVLSWIFLLGCLILSAIWTRWVLLLMRGRRIDLLPDSTGTIIFVLPWKTHTVAAKQMSSVSTSEILGFRWVTVRAHGGLPTLRFTVARSTPLSPEHIADWLRIHFHPELGITNDPAQQMT